MKNITKLFAIAIAVIGFASTSFAQTTATATATSSATIIKALTITKTQDMDFGKISVGTLPGDVLLSTAGVPTSTLTLFGGTPKAASFDVVGDNSALYTITLPSADLTITNTTGIGAETMTVNGFNSSPASGSASLSALGTANILVGATLHVSANQVAGLYVSSTPFNVTVNYN